MVHHHHHSLGHDLHEDHKHIGHAEHESAKHLRDSDKAAKKNLSNFRDNLESNVDITLEQRYEREAPESIYTYRSEEEQKTDSLQRRVQKASPKQAEVFDSQLKDAYSQPLDKAKENAAPERADNLGSRLAEREANRAFQLGDQLESQDEDQAEPAKPEPAVVTEVVTEVDPFQSEVIDQEWLVFYRKVWPQERRYIQGFATHLKEFHNQNIGDRRLA